MDKRERDYKATDLPTLDIEKIASKENELDLLKVLYGETNSNYRNLADIRFKLLGFLPAVSVIAWIEMYKNISVGNLSGTILGIAIAILGIRISYGIWIYNKRNDELYDDLVSRGRKIEEEFGVHTALFKGRLKANTKDLMKNIINHGRALKIIYSSVFIGWGMILLWYVIGALKFFCVSICIRCHC